MGNWRIVIEGMGVHHNGTKAVMQDGTEIRGGVTQEHREKHGDVLRWEPVLPTDANNMFYEFLTKLHAAGHTVYNASFECLGQIEYAKAELLGVAK